MDLIKTNKQKKRSVYKGDGYYRKLWHFLDTIWLDEHVKMLKSIVPDYVVYHGHNDESMWLDTKEIEHNFEWRIINTSELKKFRDKIYEMYASSYKKIGLIDFGGWDGLAKYLNCSCYLLTDDDGDIHGIILYWLAEYGNKISLVISETPEIGKQYVIPKLVELIQTPGFFAELSDTLEYLVNFKNNIPNIRDREVIKLLIPGLKDEDIFSKDDERRKTYPLNKKKEIPSNEGSYLRVIKNIGQQKKNYMEFLV